MQASQFPRQCRVWNPEEKVMYSPEQLAKKGFSIMADGLPNYRDIPFPAIVMWFSGKVDADGKKIFEGDICKAYILNEFGSTSIDYGVMRFNPEMGAFILMIPSAHGAHMLNVTRTELLGNEFENEELVPLTVMPEQTNG